MSGDGLRDDGAATPCNSDERPIETESRDVVIARASQLAQGGNISHAQVLLAHAAERMSSDPLLWLALGRAQEMGGNAEQALQSYYRAVMQAQWAGDWRDAATTPTHLIDLVIHAIETVRKGRRNLLRRSYDAVRVKYGADSLKRVDRALAAYLREIDVTPPSLYQRPRLFYFPDLPPGPFHDPYLQPWARDLQHAFEPIRDDARRVLAEDGRFDNFIKFRSGVPVEKYLRGPAPSWQAFFFYRHGKRFDQNHDRCPNTSRVLESIELCRIQAESPEICISVLTPGTEIRPHHGVTNVRCVMHLSLIVPENCALNVSGGGEYRWKPGEMVLFDDTYRHEAWNRSTENRIVLLMDCWNPHLMQCEKQALRDLVEMISGFGRASRHPTGSE